jgi:hypothetical protein
MKRAEHHRLHTSSSFQRRLLLLLLFLSLEERNLKSGDPRSLQKTFEDSNKFQIGEQVFAANDVTRQHHHVLLFIRHGMIGT